MRFLGEFRVFDGESGRLTLSCWISCGSGVRWELEVGIVGGARGGGCSMRRVMESGGWKG